MTRSGLRRAGTAAATACLLGAVGLSSAAALPAAPGPAPTSVVLTGTVMRLNVDDFSHPEAADEVTFVRTSDGAVQVPSSVLATVAEGSTVTLSLRSATGTRATASGALTSSLTGAAAHDRGAGVDVAGVRVDSVPATGDIATGTGFVRASTAAAAVAHSVLVVVATPPGSAAPTVTAAQVAATVNAGVASYWQQVTGGAIAFTATAYPDVVATTNAPCSSGSVSGSSAFWSEVAKASGFVSGAGKHLLVYFPSLAGCGGIAGLGSVGNGIASGGVVWTNGYNNIGVMGHELGHNLGLGHSQLLDCAVSGVRTIDAPPASCSARAYSDTNDIMAVSWGHQGFLNASHLRYLGLLGAGAQLVPTTSGSTTLAPLENGTGLRVLTLSDGATKYVVEFRQPIGQDSWMSSISGWGAPGITVRREFDPANAATSAFGLYESYLLDGDPSTPDSSFGTMTTTLPTGTWIELAGGLVGLRINSENASGAALDYRIGPATTDPRYTPPPKPVVSVPSSRLGTGTTTPTSAGPVVPVRWTWKVTTAASGSSAAASVTSSAAIARTRTTPSGWLTTAFRAAARAVDGSIVSAVGHVRTHYTTETRTAGATYSRAWRQTARTGTVGGSVRLTTAKGSSVTVKVSGRSVGVLLTSGASYGVVAIYLDGHLVARPNLRAAHASLQMPWSATFRASGLHVVRIVNLTGGARGAVGFDGTVSVL